MNLLPSGQIASKGGLLLFLFDFKTSVSHLGWSSVTQKNVLRRRRQTDEGLVYGTPDEFLQTGISGASNLAPSNPVLIDRIKGKPDPDPAKAIEGEIPRLEKAGIKPTADLVYTSGSSLDPHITPEAARAQIERVARVRGLPPNQVEILVTKNTDDRFLGIFGEPGVNLLKLNLALDAIANTQ